MRRRITLILASLMLVLCITACRKQVDSSTGNEQDSVSIVEEENSQTNISDGEIADRMSNFSVGGYEVSLPCTVGDFMNSFELEYSYPIPEVSDTMCCTYLIDGETAGIIFVYTKDGKVHDTDYIYEMSVNEFSIVKEHPFAFEVSGITEDMTREQIEEIWGEPSLSETRSIIYCDGEYENSFYIDTIIFSFDDTSGKIDDIAFFVDLDRIEELEEK